MTKPEALKIMFPNKSKLELGKLWYDSFIPEAGMINPIVIDEELIAVYGEYDGSMRDFILKKFNQEVLDALIQ